MNQKEDERKCLNMFLMTLKLVFAIYNDSSSNTKKNAFYFI